MDMNNLLALRLSASRDQAVRYLLARQSPGGAFCFYRTDYVDEPNLADTYHALRALALLGVEVPRRSQLIELLRTLPANHQPGQLYFRSLALRALDGAWEPDGATRRRIGEFVIGAPPREPSALSGWLARARMMARLQRQFGEMGAVTETAHVILGLEREGGGFGARPNLWDTWLALDLLRCCGAAAPRVTAAFVERLQTGPAGFTLTEGSLTATLDTIFAGLRCCAALGHPTRHPEAALSFVLACQDGRGGFGRGPDTLPDIELTHRAAWVIQHLTRHPSIGAPHDPQHHR